jgi:hypothetical protein
VRYYDNATSSVSNLTISGGHISATGGYEGGSGVRCGDCDESHVTSNVLNIAIFEGKNEPSGIVSWLLTLCAGVTTNPQNKCLNRYRGFALRRLLFASAF